MSISTGSLRHTIPTTKLFIVRTYDNEESERILLPQVFPAEYRKLRLIILIISIEGKQYQLFRMWSALMTLGHVFWLIGNLEMDLSEGKYARKVIYFLDTLGSSLDHCPAPRAFPILSAPSLSDFELG